MPPHKFSMNPSPYSLWGRLCICYSYANQKLPSPVAFLTYLSLRGQLRLHLLHEAILTLSKLRRCLSMAQDPHAIVLGTLIREV